MKKAILFAVLIGLSSVLFAAEKKDIFYYDGDFQQCGDPEYLQQRCRLDLSIPDGVKKFPTLVWFHGGGITSGSKHFPAGIDQEKIAIAAVNYRLSGQRAACPDYLYDSAAAVAWVLRHIAEFGGDPAKVYVAGHSAGGYLSAMIALDPKYLNRFGTDPNQLAAVFPLSGQMTTHFRVLEERRAKDPLVPSILLDEYAPISLARKNAPPLILIVGDSTVEWPARVEENLLLEARLRRVFEDKNVRCHVLPTFNHGSVAVPGVAIMNAYILK